jgi:hypothetical protein
VGGEKGGGGNGRPNNYIENNQTTSLTSLHQISMNVEHLSWLSLSTRLLESNQLKYVIFNN